MRGASRLSSFTNLWLMWLPDITSFIFWLYSGVTRLSVKRR